MIIRRRIGPANLLLDNGPIQPPDLSPSAIESLPLAVFPKPEGILRRGFLVYFDAPSRSFVHVPVAFLHHRAALEYFLRTFIKRRIFLDAEIRRRHVERDLRGVPDRRHISRSVPRAAHAELLGKSDNLARR